MPWAQIKPERVQFLSLFGYEILGDTGGFIVARHDCGKLVVIDQKNPYVWFDDVVDAMQAGATSVVQITA